MELYWPLQTIVVAVDGVGIVYDVGNKYPFPAGSWDYKLSFLPEASDVGFGSFQDHA